MMNASRSATLLLVLGIGLTPVQQLHANPAPPIAAAAQFQAAPSTLDFGSLKAGTSMTASIVVTNAGDALLVISSAAVTGSPYFSIAPAGGSVPPSDSLVFHVTFTVPQGSAMMKRPGTPSWYWNATGFAVFQHNGSTTADSVELTASGFLLLYEMPSTIEFGSVPQGSSKLDSIVTIDGHNMSSITIDSVKSDNPDFTVTPPGGFVSPSGGDTFYVAFHPRLSGRTTGHIVFWYSQLGSPDTVEVGGTGEASATTVAAAEGWNMLSVPRLAADYAARAIFPTSLADPYSFAAAYVPETTLTNGVGYWVRFSGSTTVSVAGLPCLAETIAVHQGWNLIGSISKAIAAGAIAVDPPTMTVSRLFRYANRYILSDTIEPGIGYWIRTSVAGFLILSTTPGAQSAPAAAGALETGLPPAPPGALGRGGEAPRVIALEQAFPNPFNPSTTITFSIPQAAHVRLTIFTLLGGEVATLVSQVLPAGKYSREWNAAGMASGVYYYRLQSGHDIETRKIVLMR